MKRTEEVEKEMADESVREEDLRSIPRRHLTRPGEVTLRDCKVKVTLCLDADIIEYFKARLSTPDTVPYETQINDELRGVMERDGRQPSNTDFSQLIESEEFIAAVAERVKEHRTKVSTRK